MFPVPAEKGGSNVDGAIDEGRIQSNSERKIAKRNVPQCKGQGQRIKRSRGQSGEDQRGDEQAVVVDERKKGADHREDRGRKQENPSWPDQRAEIDGEGSDEHQSDVIGAADPRAVVKTDSEVAFEIR